MTRYMSKLAASLEPYVPGEQPKDKKYVKLNTNENPYPPSEKVLAAVKDAAADLRLYPDPDATSVRNAVAKYYNDALALAGDAALDAENVFVGNGSDEVLAFVFPTFFKGKKIAFADITYSFYPVYAALFEVPYELLPLAADFSVDIADYLPAEGAADLARGTDASSLGAGGTADTTNCAAAAAWDAANRANADACDTAAATTGAMDTDVAPRGTGRLAGDIGGLLLCNPNAPTGRALTLAEVEHIVAANADKLVLLDEAYVDFGAETAVGLVNRYENLLVTQTLSKSRQLAGMRVGIAIGARDLIAALNAVKNSFNSYTADRLGIAAATAAFEDVPYFEETRKKIISTRARTVQELEKIGFDIIPSSANFIFAKPPKMQAAELFAKLKEAGVLVRYFNKPRIDDRLRISIGTDAEMDVLIAKVKEILDAQ